MKRTLLGVGITIVWFVGSGFFLYYNWDIARKMEIHHWGDFLAGISAPIAFLWLVIGYLQQGAELRINTEALLSQQKELKNQVAATRMLARISEAESQPIFQCLEGRAIAETVVFDFINLGGQVSEVYIKPTDTYEAKITPKSGLDSRDEGQIILTLQPDSSEEVNFEITYRTKLGKYFSQEFIWPDGSSRFRTVGNPQPVK